MTNIKNFMGFLIKKKPTEVHNIGKYMEYFNIFYFFCIYGNNGKRGCLAIKRRRASRDV